MATRFGPEATAAEPLQTNVTPKAPLEGVEGATGFEGAGDFFDKVSSFFVKSAQNRNKKTVAEFAERQLAVADSLSQNPNMTSAQAQTLWRRNLREAIVANPTLMNEFLRTQEAIGGLEGAGAVVTEGSRQEQLFNAQWERAVQSGYISPSATREEARAGISALQTANQARIELEQQMGTINLALANQQLGAAERQAKLAEAEAAQTRYIQSTIQTHFKGLDAQASAILNGEGSTTEKAAAVSTLFKDFRNEMQGLFGAQESGARTISTSLVDDMEEHFMKVASGELSGDIATRELKLLEDQARMAALTQNPEMLRLAITSDIVGRDMFSTIFFNSSKPVQDMFINYVGNAARGTNISTFSEDPAAKKAGRSMYEGLTSRALEGGDVGENAAITLKRQLEADLDNSGALARNPERATEFLRFMASPQFKQLVTSQPELFAELADEIGTVFETSFEKELLVTLQKEFSQASVFVDPSRERGPRKFGEAVSPEDITRPVPASSLVETVATDSGMMFQPLNPNNRKAIEVARRLNDKVKPIINSYAHASAHWQGKNNYKEQWQRMAEALGVSVEDGPGELELQDFNEGVPQIETPPGFEEDEAKIIRGESGGDPDALFGFRNRSEFSNIKVSEMTVNELIEFSDPSGPYAQSVKRQIGRVATPMGLYQIVGKTLRSTAKALGLSGEEVFTPELQRTMAKHIYKTQGRDAWEAL